MTSLTYDMAAEKIGAPVIYKGVEHGEITGVNRLGQVMVRYGDDPFAKSTDPADLQLAHRVREWAHRCHDTLHERCCDEGCEQDHVWHTICWCGFEASSTAISQTAVMTTMDDHMVEQEAPQSAEPEAKPPCATGGPLRYHRDDSYSRCWDGPGCRRRHDWLIRCDCGKNFPGRTKKVAQTRFDEHLEKQP